jgi:glucose/arabinose dehydrogenase
MFSRHTGAVPSVRIGLIAAAAAALLAGCSTGAGGGEPTWVPAPSFKGEGQQPPVSPVVPQEQQPTAPGGPAGTPDPTASKGGDPAVVATKLTAPDGIAVLPDGTALVGERTTGRIVLVQSGPHRPVTTVRTLSGLDTAGGGGLLDLALSPNYSQDNLIFAYLSTPTDNRVVDFTMTGPVTPVFTGVPKGPNDNAGRITFGSDGRLYVGTGDAGDAPLALQHASLAGKILRVTDIGRPAPDNPSPSSAIYTSGHRDIAGLCTDKASGLLFDVEVKGVNGLENVNLISAGANYGWPTATTASKGALTWMPKGLGAPGGCAIVNNNFYATSLDGRALLAAPLNVNGSVASIGKFTTYLKGVYGRLLNVVAAPDGTLWLTTSNRDGAGVPVADDERVLHIPPPLPAGADYPG